MAEQVIVLTCQRCEGENPRPLPYSMVTPDRCDHCSRAFRTWVNVAAMDLRRWRQTRTASAVEAVVNTFVGLTIAFVAQWLICWAYGIPLSNEQNFIIVSWMTGISVVRTYVVRRVWNTEFWRSWGFGKSKR